MSAADNGFAKSAPDGGSYEADTAPWPAELRVFQNEGRIEIDFTDGKSVDLPAEYLRVESPSAEVQGHGPSQKQLVTGRAHVGILELEPVGNYAIRIKFDDLHDTGIYSWRYLYELGLKKDEIWQTYLAAMAERGLSREPDKR